MKRVVVFLLLPLIFGATISSKQCADGSYIAAAAECKPALSALAATSVTDTAGTIRVTTDKDSGTLYSYFQASVSGSCPSVSQSTMLASGVAQGVSSSGTQTRGLTGLSASTEYCEYFMHSWVPTNGNVAQLTPVLVGSKFTTTAGAGGFTPNAGYSLADNGDGTYTLTKSGGGFGTKPNGAKHRFVWLWEDGDTTTAPNATHSRVTTSTTTSKLTLDTGVKPPNGVASMRYLLDTSSNASHSLSMAMGNAQNVYVFARTRFNWNGTTAAAVDSNFNYKPNRWWQTAWSGENVHSGWDGFSAGGNPRLEYESVGAISNNMPAITAWTNVWATEQYRVKQSAAAGEWHSRAGNAAWLSNTGLQMGPDDSTLNEWVHHQAQNAAGASALFAYFSIYVADDSWCRVMREDASANEEIQLVSAWSDTSITFTYRDGEVPQAGSSLIVYDASNNALDAGSW